jgi:hypothetical protein
MSFFNKPNLKLFRFFVLPVAYKNIYSNLGLQDRDGFRGKALLDVTNSYRGLDGELVISFTWAEDAC